MATTTNFGWETPDDTDLVKDGAAAMRTLGSAIDTSLVDLKGGTSGQVLSKASNTDMDFTWTANGSSGPAFRVARITSNQSITAATWTKVQFNTETFDTDNCFDSTTNYRFTPTKAGYYQVNATLAMTGTGFFVSAVYKNGTVYSRGDAGIKTSGYGCAQVGTLVYLNGSTDYIEVYAYSSTGTSAIELGDSQSNFNGVWIRS